MTKDKHYYYLHIMKLSARGSLLAELANSVIHVEGNRQSCKQER